MPIDRDHHLVHRHVQPLGGGFDDAQVGLVRHQPIQVVLVQLVGVEGFLHDRIQGLDRVLEDLAALHQDPRAVVGLVRFEAGRDADRIPEQLLLAAIGMQMGAEDAGLAVGLEHHRAGAIAEQHAGGAIGPVGHAAHGFGADHQRRPGIAGADELVGHRQAIDEARTGRVDVHRHAAFGAQPGLDQAGRGRENEVRRGGAHHDHVQVGRSDAGRLHRTQCRPVTQVATGLPFGCHVALADAGAGLDPLVAGLDDPAQVVVGQDLVRQIAAGACDTRVDTTVGHRLAHHDSRCATRRPGLNNEAVRRASLRAGRLTLR